MGSDRSEALFQRANLRIPGGVNSPVRAFRAVGGNPRFIARAAGSRMWDADGNEYIDYVGSWGPMIHGHGHPRVLEAIRRTAEKGTSFGAATELEVQMAELVCAMVPSIEMVRMVNSGTEATMSAVRLARAFTGREKIIKFEGCYHGHSDSFLIKAGSGAMTFSAPDSPGVPAAVAAGTLSAAFNDLASVRSLFELNRGEVAAVIVEPVVGNMGCIPPREGFLQGLRDLCDNTGALLIFDEVMTGFRLAPGGAQERYSVRPDLTTLGKIIGGGLPVGAYGGRREIMRMISPEGPVYQAGTLSGNPLAMAAGLEALSILRDEPEFYKRLEQKATLLADGLHDAIKAASVAAVYQHVGSMGTLFFTGDPVTDYASALKSDKAMFGRYFLEMLNQGVYLPPSQFEAAFLSAAHSEDDIAKTVSAHRKALERAKRG
jgi:glutamate-1-semialdehyde 2,1-aminomutase